MVDAGKIKQIETCLGTGESFFRALASLGFDDWHGKTLVVIGYGKVGRGIVLHALNNRMRVIVADIEEKRLPSPSVSFLRATDGAALSHAVKQAFCAVTATGRRHALSNLIDPALPCSSGVLLANMGVEDEWGPSIPKNRILNEGRPLNFILPDPTQMCYIDSSLALHNQGAVELAAGRGKPGPVSASSGNGGIFPVPGPFRGNHSRATAGLPFLTYPLAFGKPEEYRIEYG